MGQSSSRFRSKNLYDNIINEVRELLYKYEFWTRDDFCAKMNLVYYDKLIQFKKSELLDTSAIIGIQFEKSEDINKEELCVKIVQHYQKRIDILKTIIEAVERNYEKLNRVTNGPVCKNVDRYITDFFVCQKVSGLWLNEEQIQKLLSELKKIGKYENWYQHIKSLNRAYLKNVEKLQKIIETIKNDVDNSMTDLELSELHKHTDSVVKKMDYIMDIYYLLAVNYA